MFYTINNDTMKIKYMSFEESLKNYIEFEPK